MGSKKEINWGARFFHLGVIFLLFGHLFGLFVPKQFLADFGITPHVNQMFEIVAGGICAVLCIVGIAMMIHRRATNPRIRKTSRPSDWLVLVLLALVLLLGASCVINAMLFDQSGEGLFDFVNWAIALVTLQPDAYTYLIDADRGEGSVSERQTGCFPLYQRQFVQARGHRHSAVHRGDQGGASQGGLPGVRLVRH